MAATEANVQAAVVAVQALTALTLALAVTAAMGWFL
jgi:hypothetical protein